MFQNWSNYYFLLGSASGSLMGLMFIVATLFSGIERTRLLRAAAVYTTPTVFNLAVVLALSALALAPRIGSGLIGLALMIAAFVGTGHGVSVIWRFRRLNLGEAPHWSDAWCYCIGPTAVHAALGVGAILAWDDPPAAPMVLAVVLMAMLLLSIRNAWDLVTWMAASRMPDKPSATTAEPAQDVA
jgi:hypothetical protein